MISRLTAARALFGALQLAAPRCSTKALLGGRLDPSDRRIVRVLGARHLTQAVLTSGAPNAAVLALGVQVDTLHALSMLAVAAVDRRRRRPAGVSALCAVGFAAAGIRACRRASPPAGIHQSPRGIRQRGAAELASWAIPGPVRRYLRLPE